MLQLQAGPLRRTDNRMLSKQHCVQYWHTATKQAQGHVPGTCTDQYKRECSVLVPRTSTAIRVGLKGSTVTCCKVCKTAQLLLKNSKNASFAHTLQQIARAQYAGVTVCHDNMISAAHTLYQMWQGGH